MAPLLRVRRILSTLRGISNALTSLKSIIRCLRGIVHFKCRSLSRFFHFEKEVYRDIRLAIKANELKSNNLEYMGVPPLPSTKIFWPTSSLFHYVYEVLCALGVKVIHGFILCKRRLVRLWCVCVMHKLLFALIPKKIVLKYIIWWLIWRWRSSY